MKTYDGDMFHCAAAVKMKPYVGTCKDCGTEIHNPSWSWCSDCFDEEYWESQFLSDEDMLKLIGIDIFEAAAPAYTYQPLDWDALWADESEEEWLVHGVIPAKRLGVLYSAPKVGKSLLAYELAARLSMGMDVFGIPTEAKRVLYVDFENTPKGDIKPRLRDMGFGGQRLSNLFVLSFPALGKLDTEQGARDLAKAVVEFKPDLVILDTISRMIGGEENSNDTWIKVYNNTLMMLKAAEVAVLRLDHTGKDASKGQRGGSAKSGDVDYIWHLEREGSRRILTLDASRGVMPDDELVLIEKTNPLRHERHSVGRKLAKAQDQHSHIVEQMDFNCFPMNLTARQLTDWCKDAGIPGRAETLRAAYKDYVAEYGQVEEESA
jgi:hypothetical protein